MQRNRASYQRGSYAACSMLDIPNARSGTGVSDCVLLQPRRAGFEGSGMSCTVANQGPARGLDKRR